MADIHAKKSLGQNFLKDENILRKIAYTFPVSKNDLIIEIGSGKGALTKYLIEHSCSILCYEIDERMHDKLDKYRNKNCSIIYDDFLKRDIQKDIVKTYDHIYVVANIPYYITTPIIEHILSSGIDVSGMVLLVQKEVAIRFCAKPNTKDYGYFTVYLNHYFDVKMLFDVPGSAFYPAPKVTSSVVQFMKKENVQNVDMNQYSKFLKKCFMLKRKTLKNNFNKEEWDKLLPIIQKLGFPDNIRAESLNNDDFMIIFKSYLGE